MAMKALVKTMRLNLQTGKFQEWENAQSLSEAIAKLQTTIQTLEKSLKKDKDETERIEQKNDPKEDRKGKNRKEESV